MDSEDFDLKFRDLCAISIFQMLVAQEQFRMGTSHPIIQHYSWYLQHKHSNYKWAYDKVQEMALLSYQMADQMRKARLIAFE